MGSRKNKKWVEKLGKNLVGVGGAQSKKVGTPSVYQADEN